MIDYLTFNVLFRPLLHVLPTIFYFDGHMVIINEYWLDQQAAYENLRTNNNAFSGYFMGDLKIYKSKEK